VKYRGENYAMAGGWERGGDSIQTGILNSFSTAVSLPPSKIGFKKKRYGKDMQAGPKKNYRAYFL
jgi:hypothetical protein